MINAVDKTIVNKRLFFALALPDSLQQRIVQWRADNFPPEAGRPIAAANLHLTLAFLGEVSHAKAQVLQQQAGRISQSDFNVTLDDIGHWPGSGVVWLGCKNPPRGLLQLAQLLRSQAARSGCYQTPQPFHPHVSLFRGAIRPPSPYRLKPPMKAFVRTIFRYMSRYMRVVARVITWCKAGRWLTVNKRKLNAT